MTAIAPTLRAATSLRRARVAVSAVFFTLGAGFGDWVVRIPDVQHQLGLSHGDLGTALLAVAVGALVGMPLAGYLSTRMDPAMLTSGTAIAFTVSLALPAMASNLGLLIAALLVLGLGNGALGVAMNLQGALVERHRGVPIMASFHGVFSIGGLLGSVTAGAAAGAGVSARWHLAVTAAALTAVVLIAGRYLLHDRPIDSNGTFALPGWRLLAFGLLALCGLFCEGAVSDWSAVLLRDDRQVSAGWAGAGYTGFALAMAVMRLLGDRASARFGARRTVLLAGVTALVGSTMVVAVPTAWASVSGFVVMGAGLAVVFPSVISVVSSREARPAVAVSAISTVGYFGFLAGPPLIGYLAEATSLPVALGTLIACAVGITLLSRSLPARK